MREEETGGPPELELRRGPIGAPSAAKITPLERNKPPHKAPVPAGVDPRDVVSDPLLAALQAEGQVLSHGDFSLDMLTARRKLRQFQLLSPHLYPLELVGAAINGGATAIDVVAAFGSLSYAMHNARPYTKTELAHLYSNLFLPQEDQSLDRLRQLAIGLNSSLALQPRLVTVQSQNAQSMVRMELTPTAEGLEKLTSAGEAVLTTVTVRHGLGWDMLRRMLPGFDEELAFLRGRCRHASVPIRINGVPINRPAHLEPCLTWVSCQRGDVQATLALASSLPVGLRPYLEEKDRYGSLVWITGVPLGTPLDESTVVFMTAGVMLSAKPVSLYSRLPIKILCSAPGLLKNASQSDIHENARYHQVLDVLRSMVPELMDQARKTITELEETLGNPHAWPAEGAANFRRYLKAELDLAKDYLVRWASVPGTSGQPVVEVHRHEGSETEPEPSGTAAESPVAAEVEAEAREPEPVQTRARDDGWLSYRSLDGALGTGWMALPALLPAADAAAAQSFPKFQITLQERPLNMAGSSFPTRLVGWFHVSLEAQQTIPEPAVTISRYLRDAAQELLTEVTGDYPSLPPTMQMLARTDLLDYVLTERKTIKDVLRVPPMTLMGQIVHMPLFPATDGGYVSLVTVVTQLTQKQTVHYTRTQVSGRSLDPTRRVLVLQDTERQRLEAFNQQGGFKEYSQELEEEERARQLHRERGFIKPALDPNRTLAHTQWPSETLDICLWLARPYRAENEVQYYKHGVLICERRWSGMPFGGWVQGDRLQVNGDWTAALVPDVVLREMEKQVEELYANIADALATIEPIHPDYATCCQYVCQHLLAHREALLEGRMVLESVGHAIKARIFPSRQGRLVTMQNILERRRQRGKVHVAIGADVALLVPEGVVVETDTRPWLRPFLEAFFGPDGLTDWTVAALSSPTGESPRLALAPTSQPLDAALSSLFSHVHLPYTAKLGSYGNRPEVCFWTGDVAGINQEHRLVQQTEKRRTKDPGVLLHLFLAILADRDRSHEQETSLQVQAISRLLRALHA